MPSMQELVSTRPDYVAGGVLDRFGSAPAGPGAADPMAQINAHVDATNRTNSENEATQAAEQARLEAEHGMLATAGTQFGRGMLDAALVGSAVEGLGSLTGLKNTEDFGRGLGKASNADSAIEAASFLFGGGGKAGLTTSERVAKDIDEQQKAWPNLSTVSHLGGVINGTIPAAGEGALATIASGALQGAAGGAQQAYEKNEALRDVVSSALVGGALGGGTAAIGEGLSGLVNSKALKAATRELAEDANLKAAGVSRSALGGLVEDAGAVDAKATELAGALADYRFQSGPLEGKPLMRMLRTPEGIQEGVRQAAQETTEALQNTRGAIAERLQGNPELLSSLEQQFAQAGGGNADQMAVKALEALGEDPAQYQRMLGQAKSFSELGQLIQASAGKAAPDTLGTALGALSSVSGIVKGLGAPHVLAAGLLTKVAHQVIQQRSAATVAALANAMVTDTVSTALSHVLPAVSSAASGAAGRAGAAAVEPPKRAPSLTPEKEQERYREQLDKVNEAVNNPDLESRADLIDKVGDFPAPFVIAAGADMSAKMAQLHADMPKPIPNIRGKAYETLSSQQVKLANAMYEATTNPMSVFSDFAGGSVDYDKVKYAWKQYPGLQTAAQAGMMDILQTHLDEKSRAAIPDGMLTQLDNLFGFEGKLQPSLGYAFSSRMDQVMKAAPPQPKPQSSGPLKLPGSQPTFTQRIAGQQG